MAKLKLEIGQNVVLAFLNRNGKIEKTREVQVSYVGKKYFRTNYSEYVNFRIDTGFQNTEYNHEYMVFEGEKSYSVYILRKKIIVELREILGRLELANLSLEKLNLLKDFITKI
jgi:hypothetical protein